MVSKTAKRVAISVLLAAATFPVLYAVYYVHSLLPLMFILQSGGGAMSNGQVFIIYSASAAGWLAYCLLFYKLMIFLISRSRIYLFPIAVPFLLFSFFVIYFTAVLIYEGSLVEGAFYLAFQVFALYVFLRVEAKYKGGFGRSILDFKGWMNGLRNDF